jgi:hypothetical protein
VDRPRVVVVVVVVLVWTCHCQCLEEEELTTALFYLKYIVCGFGFRLRCIEFLIPWADRIEPLSSSPPTVRSPLVCGHLFCLPTSYPPSASLCSHYHFYLVQYFLSHRLSHQPLHHHHCSSTNNQRHLLLPEANTVL